MKMYILILDDIPDGFAMIAAAHASLAGYLKFCELPDTQSWLDTSFRKVICRVTRQEFDRALVNQGHLIITESALEGREVAVVFPPAKEFPKLFRFLKLWK